MGKVSLRDSVHFMLDGFYEGLWSGQRNKDKMDKTRAVLNRVLIIPADDNKLDKAKSKQKIPPNL